MSSIIKIDNLHKNYTGEHALSGVSLTVGKGCLFGLVGADGAGKSTLLRISSTLLSIDKGTVSVLGFDVARDFAKIRAQIGYMPQKFSLYQDLSVEENMLFFADLFGVKSAERATRMKTLLGFSRLEPFCNRRARDLSGGMKQKLALSCTLIHTPQVLFLDEPTTGVDPVSRKEFWSILSGLKNDGMTIIVSTPYMDEAALCDELLFLHHGKVAMQGKPKELVAQYPYTLFKISTQNSTLTIAHDHALPQGIRLLYPSGGSLHAACENMQTSGNDMLSLVKMVLPAADSVEQIVPDIEDLFVWLLSEKNNGN